MAQQKDPVCGMNVESSAPHKANYKNKDYAFCSQECKNKFQQNPDQYKK